MRIFNRQFPNIKVFKFKGHLKGIYTNLLKLNKLVKKNAADADIKAQLVELHTLFHEITEKCEH